MSENHRPFTDEEILEGLISAYLYLKLEISLQSNKKLDFLVENINRAIHFGGVRGITMCEELTEVDTADLITCARKPDATKEKVREFLVSLLKKKGLENKYLPE